MSNWTEEREAMLSELWGAGHTAQRIADMMGDGTTRNMVIGKAHRMGLYAVNTTRKKPAAKKAGMTPNLIAAHAAAQAKHERIAKERKDLAGRALGTPVKMVDLETHHCRWPIGDPGNENFHFCGADRCDGPYCKQHSRIAFNERK